MIYNLSGCIQDKLHFYPKGHIEDLASWISVHVLEKQ